MLPSTNFGLTPSSSLPPSSCSSSKGVHGTSPSETVLSAGGAPFPKSAIAQTDRRPLLLQADRLWRQLDLLRHYLGL